MNAPKGVTFTMDYNEIYMEGFIAGQIGYLTPQDCPYVTIQMIRAWTEGYEAAKVNQGIRRVYRGHGNG